MPHEKPAADAIACDCDAFYCYSIAQKNRSDLLDIKGFVPIHEGGIGLLEYLQDHAFRDDRDGVMRTYLVRDKSTNEFVGYFSLKSGAISTNERTLGDKTTFDTIPGAEIACFALDGSYRETHPESKGCGMVIFQDLIIPLIRKASAVIGIARVFLFAIPDPEGKVVGAYREYGFRELPDEQAAYLNARLKPTVNRSCTFMYLKL